MVSDTQKLLLRAFNTECDETIGKVKHTNFDASLNRIYKSAETISKLGTIMNISITQRYLDAKIKELRLAFEYQQKKQEEKEAAKAARAEQREQAKVQKELEDQQRKIEKEQIHYQTYKIGMTRRLDPQERVDELGDASVPFKFDVHAMIFSDDAPALEAALHRAFEDKKINMVNQRREFFNVTLEEIKQVVRENYDKTVEFVDIPDAEQYRISQKMRENQIAS